MGGNAFKDMVRSIKREDIPATTQFVVDILQVDGFTFDYAMASLMGSAGKKTSSNDLDYCMNTYLATIIGEPDLPVFNKYIFLDRIQKVLNKSRIYTHTFRMGNLMTAWPIAGDESNGLIQCDFIFGKYDLLKWTHYSPKEGESEFKGVFLSQAFGVLAKMKKDWEKYDLDTGERIARVGLHLSLEQGLFRKWEARRRIGMGASSCSPDEFETRFPDSPRFTRIGVIDNPNVIVSILFGAEVQVDDVNTFEKVIAFLKKTMSHDEFMIFKERYCFSSGGSQISKANNYSKEWLEGHEVWNC